MFGKIGTGHSVTNNNRKSQLIPPPPPPLLALGKVDKKIGIVFTTTTTLSTTMGYLFVVMINRNRSKSP